MMLKAGLISFALCAALFFAVSNCETQAKLRDVQADNSEDNSVAIARDDDTEEREGIDEDEDESDAEEEDSEDEDEDEAESKIAEVKDDTKELEEENGFLESDEPQIWRRRRRRRGRRGRNRRRRRRRRGRRGGRRRRRRRFRPRRGRRRGGRRRGGWRRGGLQDCPPGELRCGPRLCFDPIRESCCRTRVFPPRFVVLPRNQPCPPVRRPL